MVLDILMSDMHGREVYRRIKPADLDIPVLLASGYDKKTALHGIELNPRDTFIQKPHRASFFLKIVREMFGTGHGVKSWKNHEKLYRQREEGQEAYLSGNGDVGWLLGLRYAAAAGSRHRG